VPGVLDKQKNLLTDLTPADIAELAQDGTISGGMIPSWKPASTRSRPGARRWSCSTGVPHAMLLEIFTSRGAGTLIRA
jgi:acetylglutamate kinase